MRSRVPWRKSIATLASTTLIASAGVVAVAIQPVSAAPPSPMATGVAEWFTYLGKLGDKGALASAVTGTGLHVGSDFGLPGMASEVNSAIASADSPDALSSALDGFDGVHSDWTFTTSASLVDAQHLHVTLQAERTVDTGLGLHDPAVPFDLTSPSGVAAHLTLTTDFTAAYDGTNFSIDHTVSSPSLHIGIGGSIPDLSKVTAGLGILGVTLASPSSLTLTGGISTTFDDPNGDGHLAFTEPGGADGELAATGSAGGVATPTLDAGGTLDATVSLVSQPSDYVDNLPTIALSGSVHSGDLASGTMTASFAPGAFDTVKPFQTLGVKDLADALGQSAAALRAAERAADRPLPLMHGNLSDAILSDEALTAFLTMYVTQPTAGLATADPKSFLNTGHPNFASIQDLAEKLHAFTDKPSGASISLGVHGASYDSSDATKPKIRMTLHLARHASSAVALDVAAPNLTGPATGDTVSYADKSFTDSGKDFTKIADIAGRQVTAGSSTAVIESVDPSDSHTLLLSKAPFDTGVTPPPPPPAVFWKGGRPANSTAYSIAGKDPRTGQVEIANAFKDATGLVNVNGSVPQATITPSYDVTVPLVLDLEPAVTQNPPVTVKNDDGTSSIASSLPTTAQRIMFDTGGPLMTADLPISTNVGASAKVGFLDVNVGGSFQSCTSAAGVAADCSGSATDDTHFFALSTHDLGDVSLPDLFGKLQSNPTSLLDSSVNGKAAGSITFTVPGASKFFGTSDTVTSTMTWSNVTDPSTLTLSDDTDLSKLLAFQVSDLDDQTKLFGAVLSSLQSLDDALHATGGGGAGFEKPLPVVGKSLHDLLAGLEQGGPGTKYGADTLTDPARDFTGYKGRRILVGSQLAVITGVAGTGNHIVTVTPAWGTKPADDTAYAIGDQLLLAVDQLTSNPTTSLNDLVALLKKQLGSGIDFTVIPGATNTLKLTIDWSRTFNVRAPIDLQLDFADVPKDIVGTTSSGTLNIDVTGRVTVGLLLPLTKDAINDPTGKLEVATGSGAHLTAGVHLDDGFTLKANLGTLAMSIGNPTAADPGTSLDGKIAAGLTGPAGTNTLSQFFHGLTPAVDSSTTATCPGGATGLALCGNLPFFYKTGSTWTDTGTAFKLHARNSVAPGDWTAGAAPAGDFELPSDSALAAAVASQFIDLSALGDGLASYLKVVDQSLQVASIGGKIPMVGGDVQQGLNFVGSIRDAVTQVLPVDGSIKASDSSVVQSKLNEISAKLPGTPAFAVTTTCTAKLAPVTGLVDDASHQGDTSTDYAYRVVAVGPGSTGDARPSAELPLKNKAALSDTDFNAFKWNPDTYASGYRVERKIAAGAWRIVATTSSLNYKDTNSGADAGAAPASATDDPTVSPCPGEAIDGFKVKVVIQKGAVGPKGCTGPDCASVATRPLDLGLPGLSLSTVNPAKANDLTNADNGVSGAIGYELHMSFGISKSKGFVVYTHDNDATPGSKVTPELVVGAALNAPKQFFGRLAFLNMTAVAAADDKRTFAGDFSVDLHQPAGDPACDVGGCGAPDDTKMLTLHDITTANLGSMVTAKLQATLTLDYQLTVDADTALPGIRSDFHLDWSWASGDDASKTSGLHVGFDDVRMNPGKFLGTVLKPVFDKINMLYSPVKPVLDTISAPIPVLSDLSHLAGGDDVSILTLASTFANSGTDSKTFDQFVAIFKSVNSVLKAVSTISGACAGGDDGNYELDANFCIHLGSFTLDSGNVFSVAATPDNADKIMAPVDTSGITSAFDQLKSKAPKLDDASQGQGSNGSRGFDFPALKQPTSLFGLLLGKDVELANFDSGPLTLGFTFSESFGPVYAPPPVLLTISGSASVTAHIVAGFDTYGIRKAVEDNDASGGTKAVDFLNSLYFKTTDDNGTPIPVIQFNGELAAGAEVSAVIISVGVEGGIGLTVGFFWNDPDNDGKFRFSEFLATALNNPMCLFNVSGELFLFLKVFVTIGFSPFDVSFDFTLANIKLIDFSIKPDCTPPPPELAGVNGSTLYLFAGRLGTGGLRGNDVYDNHAASDNPDAEKVVVRQHKDDSTAVTVSMLGISEDFTGIDTVVLDGRGYKGPIQALFQGSGDATAAAAANKTGDHNSPFTLRTVVYGGENDDVIKAGTGPTWISGGGGNDQITTGDRPDLGAQSAADAPAAHVAGGDGNDSISVGNANDSVFGDGDLQITDDGVDLNIRDGDKTRAAKPTTLSLAPGDPLDPASGDTGTGNDRLSVGLGQDHVWGGGGDDVIGVAADSPLAALHTDDPAPYVSAGVDAHGGGGSDRISTGSGADTVYTGSTFDPTGMTDDQKADRLGSGDPVFTDASGSHDRSNTVDSGVGNDTVYGSDGDDYITGHSAGGFVDRFYGAGGPDVLMGGYGKDVLFGGPGDDYLVAEPSTVGDVGSIHDAFGSARLVTHTATAISPQEKILVGGGGTDRIYGGDGGAKIYGDHRDFTCSTATTPDDSTPPSEAGVNTSSDPDIADARDIIIGGEGVDDINAGGGADRIQAKGADDVVCGSAGADQVDAGSGDDHVWAGSDDDTVYGGDGIDHLYGNSQNDYLYGNDKNDVIEGNADSDHIFGGGGSDLLVGGTRAAGKPDAGDVIYGDSGNDLILGDNGDVNAATDQPAGVRFGTVYDLASSDTTLGGADTIYGSSGDDTAYGGLGNDYVYGGNDNDQLEGNPGVDHVYGQAGDDNLIGGSSQVANAGTDAGGYPDAGDTLDGGTGQDLAAGDNAIITRVTSAGSAVTLGRGLTLHRDIQLLDQGYAPAGGTSGGDAISGGDQTDLLFGQGGIDTVHGDGGDDYVEGGQGGDVLYGDAGQDDIVGGSTFAEDGSGQATRGQPDGSDTISGGDDEDVVLADNGSISRDGTTSSAIVLGRGFTGTRLLTPYDLDGTTASPVARFGSDDVTGDGGNDVILGQAGADRLKGNANDDYVEGGPGIDWIEGNDGDDDLVGGSSTIKGTDSGSTAIGQPDEGDVVWGGAGDDVALGDNAVVTRTGTPSPLTFRIGSTGAIETRRSLRLLDVANPTILDAPDASRFGADQLSGGSGVDVAFGQDGADIISGGPQDDYLEGNGGHDAITGDALLAVPADAGWPGTGSGVAGREGDTTAPDGQDDILGGSSTPGFRDVGDDIHGDGAADYELGDNGTVVRDILTAAGATVTQTTTVTSGMLPLTNRAYAKRYAPSVPKGSQAVVRHAAVAGQSTRPCATRTAGTCEPAGAFGDDTMFGDGGDDTAYGQDGNDTMSGGAGDDDLYGELGNDVLTGDAGDDVILGDRGGAVDQYENGSRAVSTNMSSVPQIVFKGLVVGTVTRGVDLYHDVYGDSFIGNGTAAKMVYDGVAFGGDDRIRGGAGHDVLHGGVGDDLMNGDSGGDWMFGDSGADVMWGGRGNPDTSADPNARTDTASPYFDSYVDYLDGGKGGASQASLKGDSQADILDWRPRGSYDPTKSDAAQTGCTTQQWPVTTGTVTVDPCSWFHMTNIDNDLAAVASGQPGYAAYLASTVDNQHHQGIDWQYGGWDRDILQADVADNGPNAGDRLLDWTGAYNLYTHCNASYGGYNDVRQFSPQMQAFLQQWAWAMGAGQANGDVTTPGTSAYEELALTYQSDNNAHGTGAAYPSTPGHFDNPNACAL